MNEKRDEGEEKRELVGKGSVILDTVVLGDCGHSSRWWQGGQCKNITEGEGREKRNKGRKKEVKKMDRLFRKMEGEMRVKIKRKKNKFYEWVKEKQRKKKEKRKLC